MPTLTLQDITVEEIPQELGRRFKLGRNHRVQSMTLKVDENSPVMDSVLSKPVSEGNEKSKWAIVAEQMAQENLLDGELGEEIEENNRIFRENFVMKAPFGQK